MSPLQREAVMLLHPETPPLQAALCSLHQPGADAPEAGDGGGRTGGEGVAPAQPEGTPASQTRGEATSRSLRLLVADDHPVVRRGLCDLLEEFPEFTVVAQAEEGQETPIKTRELHPDVLLLDYRLRGLSAVEVIRAVKAPPQPPACWW